MVFFKKEKIIGTILFLAILFLPGTAWSLNLKTFFPFRDFLPSVDVVLSGSDVPLWKGIWDEARDLARKDELSKSAIQYAAAVKIAGPRRQLLWENACVLVALGKWQAAADLLEPLVEQAPAEVDFITSLGLVMFERSRFKRALALFERAAKLSPGDIRALAGRVQCLIAVDRKNEALPLLQKLSRRRRGNRQVKKALALLAFELKRYSLARRYLVSLARGPKADLAILQLAARVHERLRLVKAASGYWRRILALDRDNREAHGRLALYYENSGRFDKALGHLRQLLAGDRNNASLLQRICRLLVQQDRFPEALPYFERYVILRPDDHKALRTIINLNVALGANALDFYRRILSIRPDDPALVDRLVTDLLDAGDGDGAIFVYEHLLRISADKAGVIRRMLPLLTRLSRRDKLRKALETLVKLDPDDHASSLRLAGLYLDSGDVAAAGKIITILADDSGVAAQPGFLVLRGRYRRVTGRDYGALVDFSAYLDKQPFDDDTRLECVDIAGRLGLIVTLRQLVSGFNEPGDNEGRLRLIADAFSRAGGYREALALYAELVGEISESRPDDAMARADVLMAEADTMASAGLEFESEGLLYRIIGSGVGAGGAARMLFDYYLPRNQEIAAALLTFIQRQGQADDPWITLFSARLMAARGDLASAYERCLGLLSLDISTAGNKDLRPEADLFVADILLRQGRLEEAERLCLTLMGREENPRVIALLYKIYQAAGEGAEAAKFLAAEVEKNRDAAAIIALAEAFERMGLPGVAASLAARVAPDLPGSLLVPMLRARNLNATGRPLDGVEVLRKSVLFTDEDILQTQAAALYAAGGDMDSAADLAAKVLLSWPERRDMQLLGLKSRARTMGRQKALLAAAAMFDADLDRKIGQALERGRIRMNISLPRRSLWDIITFNRGHEVSMLQQVMNPAMIVTAILDHSRLPAAVAPFYAEYRWRQRFRDEVLRYR